MSLLRIYDEKGRLLKELTDPEEIAKELEKLGVLFERWQANRPLSKDATDEEVIKAYEDEIKRLIERYGFKSYDVVSLTPDHPKKKELREKFIKEHTHSDFEVRYFVEGDGVFYLHPDDKVYVLHCTAGDLISVPPNTKHWFDMGENPSFRCIRLFTTPEGWKAEFTGSGIEERFPKYEEIVR
ncbi:MAG: cupin domain-containing protein [Aquificae bacterium]|nr:cupin domain-containing protein [Aquificota bacterium]